MQKIKMNKIFNLICVITFLTVISISTVQGATRLDLSSNKIISKNGDYYFRIPQTWDGYVYAERDISEGYPYFDRVNFYYKPKDVGNSVTNFFTLYTYYKDDYVVRPYEKEILTNDKYVFTMTTSTYNPYNSINDRIAFSRILIEIGTDDFVSQKIYMLADNDNIKQNGILTVNNRKVDTKPITVNNEIYLPVRETSEKLGYSVTWSANDKTIILTNGQKKIIVPTMSTKKVINRNGTIYMPLSFFMQKFNVNVDIDANNNISIKG